MFQFIALAKRVMGKILPIGNDIDEDLAAIWELLIKINQRGLSNAIRILAVFHRERSNTDNVSVRHVFQNFMAHNFFWREIGACSLKWAGIGVLLKFLL